MTEHTPTDTDLSRDLHELTTLLRRRGLHENAQLIHRAAERLDPATPSQTQPMPTNGSPVTSAEHISHAEHWVGVAEREYSNSAGNSLAIGTALAIADTHNTIAYVQHITGTDPQELTADNLLHH